MFWGADTAQLTAFVSITGHRASDLEARCAALSSLIGSATWTGPDADEFRARWEQTSPMMLAISTELGCRAELIREHAEEQDRASTPAGAAPGGGEDGAGDGRTPVPDCLRRCPASGRPRRGMVHLRRAYVEKAMAASFQDDSTHDPGQYEVIVGGSEQAAPYFQPGGAAESVNVSDIGSTFDSGGAPVVVSTPNADNSSETAKSDPAFFSSHQYVLTGSYEVEGQTYYEFHNPHGMGAAPLVLTPDEFDDYFRAARTY